jgi:hypothetical protein
MIVLILKYMGSVFVLIDLMSSSAETAQQNSRYRAGKATATP